MSSATIHHFSSHSSPSGVMNTDASESNAGASTMKPQAREVGNGSQTAPPALHHFSSLLEALPGHDERDSVKKRTAAHTPQPGNLPDPTSVHHFSSLGEALPSPADATACHKLQATGHAPTSERSELSAKQSEVIAQLAQGSSVSAAARAAGIHRTTIHHWQRTSNEFNAALEEARGAYAETLNDEMHDLSLESVRALRDLLTNPDTPPAVRLRTALAILERPHFPHPGWHLPAEIRPEHERRFLDQMAAVGADYDILRKSRALSKAASVHHNSSQDGVAELLSLMNARMPAAMAGGAAAVHHNSSENALFELLSEMKGHGTVRKPVEPSRNSLCPCGSGKKYKRCCGQSAAPLTASAA